MKLYRKLCYTILILLLILPISSSALWPTVNKEDVKKVIEASKDGQCMDLNRNSVVKEDPYDRRWVIKIKGEIFFGCDILCLSPGMLMADCFSHDGTVITTEPFTITRSTSK